MRGGPCLNIHLYILAIPPARGYLQEPSPLQSCKFRRGSFRVGLLLLIRLSLWKDMRGRRLCWKGGAARGVGRTETLKGYVRVGLFARGCICLCSSLVSVGSSNAVSGIPAFLAHDNMCPWSSFPCVGQRCGQVGSTSISMIPVPVLDR